MMNKASALPQYRHQAQAYGIRSRHGARGALTRHAGLLGKMETVWLCVHRVTPEFAADGRSRALQRAGHGSHAAILLTPAGDGHSVIRVQMLIADAVFP